jgi:mannitol-specific phosphotransferase system IIBC component
MIKKGKNLIYVFVLIGNVVVSCFIPALGQSFIRSYTDKKAAKVEKQLEQAEKRKEEEAANESVESANIDLKKEMEFLQAIADTIFSVYGSSKVDSV